MAHKPKKPGGIQHRVWIELEFPKDHAEGHARAAMMSAMLKKLGVPYEKPVWWHQDKWEYCVTLDESGCYLTMSDKGHWFNLEFLAK